MNISKDALMEKTLLLLEYPKIMERVSEYALSAEAAEIIKNSKPVMDNSAEEVKEKVSAIHFALTTCSDEPRSFLPAIGFLFPKLETEGAVLELDEALAIGLFMEQGTQLTGWIKKNINTYNDSLYDCSNIAAEIFKIIDREGKIRDLPVLRAIRKRIENLEKEIKASISGYLTDEESKKALQSFLPSQRDGRAVLAVKSNFRGRIRGIVHEASSSGQTVFIEPLDVVEKNNELLLEKHNFDAEIHKILRELTKKISVYSEELKSFHAKIIKLECLRTKAKYSAAIKGCFAKNSSLCGESLCLKQARHPLLKKAVPIDIMMEKNIRTLIITGPNTGGKTVALKTLGYLL